MEKYIKYFFSGIIVIVVLLTMFAFFVNGASNSHIDQIESTSYASFIAAEVKEREIRNTVSGVSITAEMNWSIDVNCGVDGVISQIVVKKGQKVKKGDVLFYIRNNGVPGQLAASQADIEGAVATLRNYEIEVNRYAQLLEYNAVSQADYDNAVAKRDAQKARVASLTASSQSNQEQVDRMTVYASQDGTVINIYLKEGAYVSVGQSVMMLGDMEDMKLKFNLKHKDAQKLMYRGERDFKLNLSDIGLQNRVLTGYSTDGEVTGSLKSFEIHIDKLDFPIESNVERHTIFATVKNKNMVLQPTTYSDVQICSLNKIVALSVPKYAVKNLANTHQDFVYLVNSDNKLEKREVETGVVGERFVEIRSGLKEGDIVLVLDSIETVKEGQSVQVDLWGE